MLRRLQTIDGKNIDVQAKADVAMVRGMLVQKDYAGKAILPTTQVGLYFVNKDIQATGLMSYEGEISDYDTRFETIAVGDFVQLEKPMSGERYATDQIVKTNMAVGRYVAVSVASDATKGKLVDNNTTASVFKFVELLTVDGKEFAVVEVV